MGSDAEAMETCRRAQESLRALLEKKPGDIALLRFLGTAHNLAGTFQQAHGEYVAARESYARAVEIRTGIVASPSAVPDDRDRLALSWRNLAQIQASTGLSVEADRSFRAIELLDALIASVPEEANYRHDLAGVYGARIRVLTARGKTADACRCMSRELRSSAASSAKSPEYPAINWTLESPWIIGRTTCE